MIRAHLLDAELRTPADDVFGRGRIGETRRDEALYPDDEFGENWPAVSIPMNHRGQASADMAQNALCMDFSIVRTPDYERLTAFAA
ncbi:hypothetical protein BN2475_80094 [Paraburkholderia ribeironis]|uniref:Uncharacterized protein n=1 Tax=Paraburkholderia ribeironis TaxID=1247936 RepID=A0A1N7RMP4_9BURK|nr:hypothetical protein BN2475_80094 [Paraburkholderia ribeironis]